jgi:signal transduction histidine kinase
VAAGGGGFWSRLSLIQRFALTGGLVMLAGMAALGSWVSTRIEDAVVRNTAVATALYMESFISPLSQELARSDTLAPESAAALREIFATTPLGERVVSYKIWKRSGRVVDARDPELVGRVFKPSAGLKAAWDGHVTASFDDLDELESAAERAMDKPLLEIYSPIRASWSGEVIAVAEFYEVASGLEDDIFVARLETWAIVGAVIAAMAALLFGLVLSGSRTIGRQRLALEAQVNDLARLAAQNDRLRQRVQRASSRAAELNERFLRRISAELHDGPAQLLGFAALRLGSLAGGPGRPGEIGVVRDALDRAMREVRDISRGLALPDLDGMGLAQVVERAVEGHRRLTGSAVAFGNGASDAVSLDHSLNICAYRFVQEGLTNAFRHGGGRGQAVVLRRASEGPGSGIEIAVSDRGPGFPAESEAGADAARGGGGLGLAGLRERIESLGGRFCAANAPGGGAVLTMVLPSQEEGG